MKKLLLSLAFIVLLTTGCEKNLTYIADPVDEHDYLRLNEDLPTDEELQQVRCWRISSEVDSDGNEPQELGVACLEPE
jgi:hypothetical protein